MSTYQIVSSVIALLAIIVSLIALIRTRDFAKEQLKLDQTQATLNALSALVSGYTEQANLFERILENGTADERNLDIANIESIIEDYHSKRHESIKKIEEILK